MSEPIVVIGAGLAGWTTVREFRKLDTNTPVVMVTADSGDFYAKPSLSNAFAQRRLPAQLVTTPAAKMAETLNVTLMAQTQVTRINVDGQTLSLQCGDDTSTLDFSQLVLAMGAQPIRAPMNGNAIDQVNVVNSLDDFAIFHALLQPNSTGASETHSQTIVLIGAGLIGCEFANDLVQSGHTVHVVDPAPGRWRPCCRKRQGLSCKRHSAIWERNGTWAPRCKRWNVPTHQGCTSPCPTAPLLLQTQY